MSPQPQQSSALTFIGTATCLLELGPFRVLTDPNFLHRGERAWLGHGLVAKRITDPALSPAELPPLDLVLLSHLHGDHWDRRARGGLDHALPVVTTPQAARKLRRWHGFGNGIGLQPWEQHSVEAGGTRLRITATPGVHSTNPAVRALLPPVMGSVLELESEAGAGGRRLWISGDTMLCEGVDEVGRRYPDLDLAIVHTGGTTLPFGAVVTMTGPDAAECLRRVGPRVGVPVHYDDYRLFRSGLDDVRRAVDAAGLGVEMRYVERGDTIAI